MEFKKNGTSKLITNRNRITDIENKFIITKGIGSDGGGEFEIIKLLIN